MRTVDRLLAEANQWLAQHSRGGSDKEAWEAAGAVLDGANHEDLGTSTREILDGASGDDRDARNIVASFRRLHPPQSLGNPHRQRELVGLYLVLREGGLWDTSNDLGNPLWMEEIGLLFE